MEEHQGGKFGSYCSGPGKDDEGVDLSRGNGLERRGKSYKILEVE